MAMPQNPMSVVFALQPGYRNDLVSMGKKLTEIIRNHGRRQNFLVSSYELVIQNPLGKSYDNCSSDEAFSPYDY